MTKSVARGSHPLSEGKFLFGMGIMEFIASE